jgi:8-oxo-dGTP pyrophosphatase MutT (NUDIX family)
MSAKRVQRVAGKAVIEAQGGILVLHPSSIDLNRKWHIPGGIRDDIEEPIRATAIREVREETGMHLDVDSGQLLKVGEWPAVDKGEAVKILAVFFLFKLANRPTIKLSHEHDSFAWLDSGNLHSHDTNPEVREIVLELLS